MNVLRKLERNDTKEVEKTFYVLDVETKSLNAIASEFVFGVIYGHNYYKVFYSIEAIQNELKKQRFNNKYVFAHNAEFDFTCIFGNIIELDNSAIFSGSGFICARYGKVKLVDSLNILKSSVKEIGKQIGIEKLENEEIFKQLSKGIITNEAIEYCKIDCVIIYEALLKFYSLIGKVKITIASSALYYFRSNYQEKDFWYDKELANKYFDSYYGGRVECFQLGRTISYKSDINSMYPYIMKSIKFPDYNSIKKWNGNFDYFIKYYLLKENYEGLIYCKVEHYPTTYGFLPVKAKGKLIFPNGIFSGCWNFNELRFALKNNAIKILEITDAYYSKAIESPFIKYVDETYLKRTNSTGFESLMFKYLLNSLYGKFGEKTKMKSQYFKELPIDKIKQFDLKGTKYRIQSFNIKRDDCFLLWEHQEHKQNSIPLFASYITSGARILLLNYLLTYDSNKITYCDTDSICSEIVINENEKTLGKLKLENEVITNIRGLKNYDEMKLNELSRKIKGIPKKAIEYSLNLFKFETMNKTKSSLRNNTEAGRFVKREKTITNKYDKRTVLKNGKTETIKL